MAQIDGSTVLVTGAGGFIGSALCSSRAGSGRGARHAVRRGANTGLPQVTFAAGDIGPKTDWRDALAGTTCVVHLAARTHVLRETAADPLAQYHRVNVEGTRRLAEQAAAAGMRRLAPN